MASTVGEKMQQKYALMVDVQKSRGYDAELRYELQKALDQAIAYLNAVYANYLDKPVMWSGGDEVQGLFNLPEAGVLYYRFLNLLFGGGVIRGSIGKGQWSLVFDGRESTIQDGSAYHNARAALKLAERSSLYDFWYLDDASSGMLETAVLNQHLVIAASRTHSQNEISLALELLRPLVLADCDCGLEGALVDVVLSALEVSAARSGKSSDQLIANLAKGKVFYAENVSPCVVAVGEKADRSFETSVNFRGLSNRLSLLLGITRQSAGDKINRAMIAQERSSVVASLAVLESLGGGSR